MVYIDRWGKERTPPMDAVVRPRKGVFLICVRDNRLLLIAPEHAPKVLELPGGGIDAGESVFDAAVREFVEETGFTIAFTEKDIVQTHTQHVAFYANDVDEYWQYDQTFFVVGDAVQVPLFDGWRPTPENGQMAWLRLNQMESLCVHHAHGQALRCLF